ncbi:hypothetical protein GOBAR_AA22843 [Gossypium barbadense]|uniref:Uncharacterized protein n=1 Tax=Gossypium barbadense TaxID=3634 RepID=A0A2P5X3B1_GOSBA|nr:hypothetical protein GOBAR_AA22843 [Gossypium barbadense]
MEARHVFFEDVKDAMVGNSRMARSLNVEVYSDVLKHFELWRPSVFDSVYYLGHIELISETDGAIAEGSKNLIIHVRMSW